MRHRFLAITGALVTAIVVALVPVFVAGQASTTVAGTGTAPRTAWGEPDLQGIWTQEHETPLERDVKYGGREFLSEAEIAARDKERVARIGISARGTLEEQKKKAASVRGTESDVSGAYNREIWNSVLPTGRRTSLVVDPANGRIPPYTPEAKKQQQALHEYELAILSATAACKNGMRSCKGGKFGPPSARRAEPPPVYNVQRINRSDGPEDRGLAERCLAAQDGTLPDFSGHRRIVQTRGAVSVFYDLFQGQGGARVIPVTTDPHFPSNIRQWWGDSRGHWEGNTLVVDVTNFSGKSYFMGSRENLHLIERWTRRDANTLEYTVTIEDPMVWTKPWTVKQELTRQNGQANRIYYEPRCHEGNFGMLGLLAGMRAAEKAFAEGRGPDPATIDVFSTGPTNLPEEQR